MDVKWKRVRLPIDREYENAKRGCVHRTYKLSEPVTAKIYGKPVEVEYVAADFAYTIDRGPETMLFKADKDGDVLDWGELLVEYYDSVSDDSAIEDFVKMVNSGNLVDREPEIDPLSWLFYGA